MPKYFEHELRMDRPSVASSCERTWLTTILGENSAMVLRRRPPTSGSIASTPAMRSCGVRIPRSFFWSIAHDTSALTPRGRTARANRPENAPSVERGGGSRGGFVFFLWDARARRQGLAVGVPPGALEPPVERALDEAVDVLDRR